MGYDGPRRICFNIFQSRLWLWLWFMNPSPSIDISTTPISTKPQKVGGLADLDNARQYKKHGACPEMGGIPWYSPIALHYYPFFMFVDG